MTRLLEALRHYPGEQMAIGMMMKLSRPLSLVLLKEKDFLWSVNPGRYSVIMLMDLHSDTQISRLQIRPFTIKTVA